MHIPVLQKEVLEYLNPKANENFIDCTIGDSGHGIAILEAIEPNGKLLGIDWDLENIYRLKIQSVSWRTKFKNRLILINDNFVNLKEIVQKEKFGPVSGILFDLGMSSWHLKESGRGFSFLQNEPLDMRYNKNAKCEMRNAKLTAEEIVNKWSEKEIEQILKEYGEERFAEKITKRIIEERKITPIRTTFQLVEIIRKAVPRGGYEKGRIHPATRTFQALRITVNDELNNLEKVLPQALNVLKPGGRLAVISFHSLEDRIVKNFFKENKLCFKTLTKKPIRPTETEIKLNPHSRSAKLRAAEKTNL